MVKDGQMTLTTPLLGVIYHVWMVFAFAMFNLCTKFDVPSFSHYKVREGSQNSKRRHVTPFFRS